MIETENQEPIRPIETASFGDRTFPFLCIMLVFAATAWAFWSHNRIGLGISIVGVPFVAWNALKSVWALGAKFAYEDSTRRLTEAVAELVLVGEEADAVNDVLLRVIGPS